MPGHISGRDAARVVKQLGLKVPRKKGAGKKKSNWKPGPLDEAMADNLRKKFNIDPDGWTG